MGVIVYVTVDSPVNEIVDVTVNGDTVEVLDVVVGPETAELAADIAANTADIAANTEDLSDLIAFERNAQIRNAAATSQGITTAAWTVIQPSATLGGTFTKVRADTSILVEMHVSYYLNTILGRTDWGIALNGVTTWCLLTFQNSLGQHDGFSGVIELPGIDAGTYSWSFMWRTQNAGGSAHMDANDNLSIRVKEILRP